MFLDSNFNYNELKDFNAFTYISPETGEEDFINTEDINTLNLDTENISLYNLNKKKQQENFINFNLNYKKNEKIVILNASILIDNKEYETKVEIDLKGFCDLLALGKNMQVKSIDNIEKIKEIKTYAINNLSILLFNNKILVQGKSIFVNGYVFSDDKRIGYFTNLFITFDTTLTVNFRIDDYIGYLDLAVINNIKIEIETGKNKISFIPTSISENHIYFSKLEYTPNISKFKITKEDIKNNIKRMDLLDDPSKQIESSFVLDENFL